MHQNIINAAKQGRLRKHRQHGSECIYVGDQKGQEWLVSIKVEPLRSKQNVSFTSAGISPKMDQRFHGQHTRSGTEKADSKKFRSLVAHFLDLLLE